MTDETRAARGAAAALREAFDRTFAEAPAEGASLFEDFLAVRVAGDPYAIRLAELAGLHCDRKVVGLAGDDRGFLGIASLRGALVPVYDLGTLLGYASAAATPRWLVLARAPSPLALAFDLFESHVRIPLGEPASPSAAAARGHARPHVLGAVRADDSVRPIIHIASLLQALIGRAHARTPTEP